MFGSARYFAPRMFAPRYFPKVGEDIILSGGGADLQLLGAG